MAERGRGDAFEVAFAEGEHGLEWLAYYRWSLGEGVGTGVESSQGSEDEEHIRVGRCIVYCCWHVGDTDVFRCASLHVDLVVAGSCLLSTNLPTASFWHMENRTIMAHKFEVLWQRSNQLLVNYTCNSHASKGSVCSNHLVESARLAFFQELSAGPGFGLEHGCN